MARGHRGGLQEIGQDLNLIPYLDMMTMLVMFMLVTITSFLSFTILNASIPQLAPDAAQVKQQPQKKEQLLLMVRVTKNGYLVDPNVQGGMSIPRQEIPKKGAGFDMETLKIIAEKLKERFPQESRVLIISEPAIVYDDIIKTMDVLREKQPGTDDLFPDVTLSIL
ncbi:MAG: biopolymer transporter ExbD [Pseudomonadota bacterium]